MQIVEFTGDSLRFLDAFPEATTEGGFVWAFLDRADLSREQPALQAAAQRLGGSPLLELHWNDLGSDVHPSHYDGTSVYDIVIFRRLASLAEVKRDSERDAAVSAYHGQGGTPWRERHPMPESLRRINSRAVGFAVFDRLLISVHPSGCATANTFLQRYLADAKVAVEANGSRSRLPSSPADLALRMINTMVDSYLDLRRELSSYLEQLQAELLKPNPRFVAWGQLMDARRQLALLEDLCEEQQDAMQEWIDTLRELPLAGLAGDPRQANARRDALVVRARDVQEHIDRVIHHARRLEQAAETAVQIHFSAQGHRTNDIMRTLTAVTAVFLPLNLFTGFFGMNFEHLPLIHSSAGMWFTFGAMVLLVVVVVAVFLRKRYIDRSR
ncbi:magnesium transporter CorA family protein [Ottowia sp.]|uniref:magnesium transporter CorA family protein n=1 Tax=Ottowia sp. TaxID=1898956 RepID=UPI001D634B4D|nr:magnesium transporter CorA family protein [Ottowia sp.]MCB2024274.1 magnesium transporter CorA family protein [Ottowia sp.]MCP5258849.1 magnesium transporter CorA family protein [Burkholderiaceae bacterium]HPK31957.1 magnesium transporter CorA family protein [Ottowia sp.]HRW73947.1 magnesium transporter CorA family protein [Ottowia sp.]